MSLSATHSVIYAERYLRLNSRQHVYSKSQRAGDGWASIPMNNMTSQSIGSGSEQAPVNIVVTKDSQTIVDGTVCIYVVCLLSPC